MKAAKGFTKGVAGGAANVVKGTAKGTANVVKGTAHGTAAVVKGTAHGTAAVVKGTAHLAGEGTAAVAGGAVRGTVFAARTGAKVVGAGARAAAHTVGVDIETAAKLSSAELAAAERRLFEAAAAEARAAKQDARYAASPGARLLESVVDGVHHLSHLIAGVLFAYAVGWLGLHVSWALLALAAVYAADREYKRAGFARRHRAWRHAERLAGRGASPDRETATWLNAALAKFFPVYSPEISDGIEAAMIQAIDAALATPPTGITGVSVSEVSLGVVPPSLHDIKVYNTAPRVFHMDATLRYNGDVKIVVAVGVGKGVMSTDFPIAVKNVSLEGRLRVLVAMRDTPPLTKEAIVCFKSAPVIGFELELLGPGDITQVPGIGKYLRSMIDSAVADLAVFPNRQTVAFGAVPPPGWEADEDEDAAAAGVARTRGELIVKVLSAADLVAADKRIGGDSSDPYAKLTCGDVEVRTETIARNLNPVWEQTFRLPAPTRAEEQMLVIEVKDEDKVGRNDSLGKATLDFSEIVGDADAELRKRELKLVGPGIDKGSVTIEYGYSAE